MRRWTLAVASCLAMVGFSGCKNVAIGTILVKIVSIPFGEKIQFVSEKSVNTIAVSDAMSSSPGTFNSLVDTDSTFTTDSTTAPQALVTVTTDTGQTFQQTFTMVPADASSFAPA